MSRSLIIAAGGTGGHMFPAQALSAEMLGRGWRVILSSDERGMRYAGGFPEEVVRVETRSATFARGGLMARLAVPWHLLVGSTEARRLLKRHRASCVVGFGGYPSLPALSAALSMKVPRLIHEQNGVLGRVNRIFAKRVNRVVCGTWPVRNAPEGARLVHLGNPVRPLIRSLAEEPYSSPKATGMLKVLVIGGSQGARALSRYAPRALAALPTEMTRRMKVMHQARQEDLDEAEAIYKRAGIDVDIAPFFDDLPQRMKWAQLVVSRAGASSVAEIAAMARPSILIPYPHAMDDHQSANARPLELVGGAVVLHERSLSREGLTTHIQSILENPVKAQLMSDNTAEIATPNATKDLADLVESLGEMKIA